MRQLDNHDYLLTLSKRLDEIIKELEGLPDVGSEALGGWLRLHDTSALVHASAILHRLSLWAKWPDVESYIDRGLDRGLLRLLDGLRSVSWGSEAGKPW